MSDPDQFVHSLAQVLPEQVRDSVFRYYVMHMRTSRHHTATWCGKQESMISMVKSYNATHMWCVATFQKDLLILVHLRDHISFHFKATYFALFIHIICGS